MSLLAPRSLTTKVGRRLFGIFMAFALVPVLLFSASAYRQVSAELESQARERLHQLTKGAAMGVAERLTLVADLVHTRATLYLIAGDSPVRAVLLKDLPPGVLTMVVRPLEDLPVPSLPPLTEAEQTHLERGRPVLLLAENGEFWTGIRLNDLEEERVLWTRIDPDFVWGVQGGALPLPPETDFCAFGPDHQPLTCTAALEASALPQLDGASLAVAARSFRWEAAGDSHLAAVWPLFLGFEFAAGSWNIVVSERWSHVVAPIRRFQTSLILIVLLVVSVISGLSARFIRSQMTPLARLRTGTGIVARGEFDHRVEVTSDDEFGDLSVSFNQMASDLGRHVRTLEAGHAIDRAVLSSRQRTEIVNAVLRQAPELLPGDSIGLALAANARDRWSWTVSALDAHGNLVENLIEVTEGERTALERSPEGVVIDLEAEPHGRSYLALEVLCQERSIARAFPLVHGGWLQGAVILSFRDRATMGQGELHRVHQLADRIAVAASNARLVEDLDQMHQGTLTTLARAIDAKSHWTAGHSERVTELAVALGQRLGFDAELLTRLYRGGLLHDVGKIGVPAEIIDKPSALSEAERGVMESHTRIGARILAPIAAYHDIMDIVRHHHERWDGMGYPDQLSGEEIPLLARVTALADVYDALTSARPYRAGWEHEYALAAIRRGGGSAFDPILTQEFVGLMATGWTTRVPRNASSLDPVPALVTGDITEDLLRG